MVKIGTMVFSLVDKKEKGIEKGKAYEVIGTTRFRNGNVQTADVSVEGEKVKLWDGEFRAVELTDVFKMIAPMTDKLVDSEDTEDEITKADLADLFQAVSALEEKVTEMKTDITSLKRRTTTIEKKL